MSRTERERRAAESARILAASIVAARERFGLTQTGLAEKMHVHQSAIARWENPKYRGWTGRTLRRLCEALNCRLRVQFILDEEFVKSGSDTEREQ